RSGSGRCRAAASGPSRDRRRGRSPPAWPRRGPGRRRLPRRRGSGAASSRVSWGYLGELDFGPGLTFVAGPGERAAVLVELRPEPPAPGVGDGAVGRIGDAVEAVVDGGGVELLLHRAEGAGTAEVHLGGRHGRPGRGEEVDDVLH